MKPAFDLAPSKPLSPADAVAALIRTKDGRYLLQHRDAKRTIFYPDHWGCFGGAMEAGESPVECLRRELHEELELDLGTASPVLFSHFRFSVEPAGIAALDRYYYDVPIEADDVARYKLGEGAGMELVDGREALHERRLVPYDSFALWLHFYQGMLAR
jgi:8-oxo-dGTP pyrophosphatase MutT (NUDIX family)